MTAPVRSAPEEHHTIDPPAEQSSVARLAAQGEGAQSSRHAHQRIRLTPRHGPAPVSDRTGRPVARTSHLPLVFACLIAGLLLSIAIVEMNTYYFESRFFARRSKTLTYELAEGPSHTITFPSPAPLPDRRGYSHIEHYGEALRTHGFEIDSQARWSTALTESVHQGLNAIYSEKTRAGVHIMDGTGHTIYHAGFPRAIYSDYDSIPPLLIRTLLTIEDKHLLDSRQKRRNPAVDWPRFLGAVSMFALSKLGLTDNAGGASTLATQLEKYRYSPHGLTSSPGEKLRQMLSASYRWYRDGQETFESRKSLLLEYLNSVPLAAAPGHGEIHGFGEGMEAWFGTPLDSVNAALGPIHNQNAWRWATSDSVLERTARCYRMVVSLIVSFRRASYYLLEAPEALQHKTDQYLRLLHREGIIPYALYEAAYRMRILPDGSPGAFSSPDGGHSRTALRARTHLLSLIDVAGLYQLDRIDMQAVSTLDQRAQTGIETLFHQLYQPASFQALSLRMPPMLERASLDKVVYGLTLYERSEGANLLRIHADSYDRALSLNDGTRMDLGSTAKLRTLVHYLEIIEALHSTYTDKSADELRALQLSPEDSLRRWARLYVLTNGRQPVDTMLRAALDRSYSAHPWERFFTGGGYHRFRNFDASQDKRSYSVRAAFTLSVNLVFVRLLRDIVEYHIGSSPRPHAVSTNTATPRTRSEYLGRFTRYESRLFVRRFYRRLKGIPPHALTDSLAKRAWHSRVGLATLYASVTADPDPSELAAFLRRHNLAIDSGEQASGMLRRYGVHAYDLADRAYLASIHPFELTTARCLARNPRAAYDEVLEAALIHVDAVYRWLYKTSRRGAQDRRIRIILEQDAFDEILEAWQRLGFPFSTLVPSYATSLGASADRPSALSTLAGIIQNDGMLYPERRFTSMRFAHKTPYETMFTARPDRGVRLLSQDVARAVRGCLFDVVEKGTAIRLRGGIELPDGSTLRIGGKTGTGDHRLLRYDRDGRLVRREARSRSAVFVFVIGERFYGTITVVVPGSASADYRFTSSYAVQLLKHMVPELAPLFTQTGPAVKSEHSSTTPWQTALALSPMPPRDTVVSDDDSTPLIRNASQPESVPGAELDD